MPTLTPYETIKQYIIDDTGRGDKFVDDGSGGSIGSRRIQRAVQRFHRMDMWYKDLQEKVYVFEQINTVMPQQSVAAGGNSLFMNQMQPPAQYVQQVDTKLLPGYRHLKYIRKWQTVNPWGVAIVDPTSGQIGTVQDGDLAEISPDSLVDGYGYDRMDVYYASGDTINIRSSTPLSQVYIGYFIDPSIDLTQGLYNSWIAVAYPSLIAADVKARIFSDIGKDEEKKGALGELQTEIMVLQTNNVRVGTK